MVGKKETRRAVNVRVPESVAKQIDDEHKKMIAADPTTSYSFSDALRRIIVRGLAVAK